MSSFDYAEAFTRNIGIFSKEEQETLRHLHVAIPGMGGLGGNQLMTLARLGVMNFTIADFDRYELANFNRQYGATMDTIGESKADVMAQHVKSINPDANIRIFKEGLTVDNAADFLKDVDIVLDAIDLSAMPIREKLYSEAYKRDLYVIACGPVGFGFFCIIVDPSGKSFEETFQTEQFVDNKEKMARFLSKLTPSSLHAAYMPQELVDIDHQFTDDVRFSWISPALFLAAGNGIAELVAIVLRRKTPISLPRCYQYDALLNRLSESVII